MLVGDFGPGCLRFPTLLLDSWPRESELHWASMSTVRLTDCFSVEAARAVKIALLHEYGFGTVRPLGDDEVIQRGGGSHAMQGSSQRCPEFVVGAGGGMRELSSAPPAWQEHAPALFRLPGFGGAAVLIRSAVVRAVDPVTGSPAAQAVLGFDVGLLSPLSHFEYRARPAAPLFADRLSAFLLGAAGDVEPEASVAPLIDDAMGLRIRVVSSDDEKVGLLVAVDRRDGDPDIGSDSDAVEPHSDDSGSEGLNFETSRAALVKAAHDARFLDHVGGDPGGRSEPPVDWSAR